MKKALSILLALCLLLGALPMLASAADSDFVIDVTVDGSKQLTGYTGPDGDVVMPAGISLIRGGSFEGDHINSVTISEGVTSIVREAFYCPKLKWISIPVSVTYIMSNSIMCESLTDIYYAGSKEQWNKILFDFNFGDALAQQADIHYNSTGPSGGKDPGIGGFSDVKSTDYYAGAVKWAVDKGITSGIGGGKFGPSNPCTREQIVTFLWNDAGKPAAGSAADFKDMPKNETYQKAISWAAEKSITSGYAGNVFRPGKTCTRAEAMTFIWRAHNCPEPSSIADLTDLPEIPDFRKAISWAYENGILAGDGKGHCLPGKNCTRAEIVSFLYRAKDL